MKSIYFILAVLLLGCGEDDLDPAVIKSGQPVDKRTTVDTRQLNITMLLDLSDRIDPKTNPDKPEHYERDIAVIKYCADYFLREMAAKGRYMARGKIKVIFSPRPLDPGINVTAGKLNVDLSGMGTRQKKEAYDSLATNFATNASSIYQSIIRDNKWLGSDVWRFFKNDVKDYAIAKDTGYRNVLIILTDGYLYHQDSKDKIENRYAYILPALFEKYKLRRNPDWEAVIDKQDFGLIAKRNDLQDLEVLVLEVSPSSVHKNDEDIIKKVLGKWFKEMNIKRFSIFNSDLPEYTRQRISSFLK